MISEYVSGIENDRTTKIYEFLLTTLVRYMWWVVGMASVGKLITSHKTDNKCWKTDNFFGWLSIIIIFKLLWNRYIFYVSIGVPTAPYAYLWLPTKSLSDPSNRLLQEGNRLPHLQFLAWCRNWMTSINNRCYLLKYEVSVGCYF